ncbi:MAG: hypothetical protein WCX65_10325 [bacterium]
MAKKDVKAEPVAPPEPEPKQRSFLWVWITVAALSFIFFLAALHMSGAVRGVEEGIYGATKDIPVIGFLTAPLHREKWAEKLSPDTIIDVKDLQSKLIRSEGEVESLKKAIAEMTVVTSDVSSITSEMKKVKKDISDLKTGEVGAAAPSSMGASQASAPGSLPPAIVSPGATAQISPVLGGGDNYRAIAKIFEKLPADTAVDILNNLSDQEKVKILTSMKQKTVADILAAFDPIKSAELMRMMAKAG